MRRWRPLKEIRLAAERAAALTRQLLTFSRKQEGLRLQRIDLRQVVAGLKNMLQHTLGDDIQLKTVSDSNRDCVLANPAQMEQVVLNLAIRAFHDCT